MNDCSTARTSALALLLLAATSATACGSATDSTDDTAATPATELANGTIATDSDEDEDEDELAGATLTTQSPIAVDAPIAPDVSLEPAAPSAPEAPPDAPATPAAPATSLDADGVRMLLPSAAGASFRLGTNDPNGAAGFQIEQNVVATAQKQGALTYWRTQAFNLNYSAGGTGKTSRLHVIPNAGDQKYTWKSENGFLLAANDFKNQEFTAYVRVHDIFDVARAAVSLKIRGGRHVAGTGDFASCTMMTLKASTTNPTMFGKELTHPSYDYVKLAPRFDSSLKDGQWIGLKLVSYAKPNDAREVVNQLYVDTTPFDADGKPLNSWRLLSEYLDTEGKSTGKYSKLADWGGSQTTVRTDGVSTVDFAFVSVREITPPS